MAVAPPPPGRRERNKQEKLERITAAATALFAEHGVDEVTTQQIADAADIGTGTLFLYAKTKGELLLLVQNALYSSALEHGRAAASEASTALDAIVALLTPIVACNRIQIENGRTYLREMVFGDNAEPHHAEALEIVAQTEDTTAELLVQHTVLGRPQAVTLARVISAIMFLTMASSANRDSDTETIISTVREHVAAILPR